MVFVRFCICDFCFRSLKTQGIGIVSLYSSSNRGSPSETTRFLFIWAKIQRASFTGNRFAEKLGGWGIHHESWCDLVVGHIAFVWIFHFCAKWDLFECVDFPIINRIFLSETPDEIDNSSTEPRI